MNCITQLKPDRQSPTVPTRVRRVISYDKATLSWAASMDNQSVLGYNIYVDNKKTGFTPLLYFDINKKQVARKSKIVVKAVDMAGNESAAGKVTIFL